MSGSEFNNILGRIKEKVLLSQIVRQDLPLQKKGREYVGNCPFHNEKTGSFFVNDEKGTFHCFGCGASGDVFEYVMKKRGVQFIQAVESIAEIAGIKLPEKKEFSADLYENQKKILQKAVEYFKGNLSKNQIAMEYCKSREIDSEIIEKFSIGYSPINGDEFLSILKKNEFSEADIIASGLYIKKENGKLNPRFRDRIMFPVFDKKGWPIAFGGRGIQKDSIPKYLNSPETDIFQKRETLYGYNISSKNVSDSNQFIVVEGYMDVVTMHIFGFNTAIASMGTAFSAEHIAKIWRYSNEPVICFDGDSAGYNAMVKSSILALNYLQPGKSLKFCLLPIDSDPDSFLKEKGKIEMQKLLDNSLDLIDFLWKHFEDQLTEIDKKTPEKIAMWKKNIYEIIGNIQNTDIKNLYKTEINDRIFKILKKSPNNNRQLKIISDMSFSIDKKEKMLLREAILLYILIMRPSIISFVVEELSLVEFTDKNFEKIRNFIAEYEDNLAGLENTELKNSMDLIKIIGSKNCNIDAMDEECVLDFWHNIFEFGFSKISQKKDFMMAKKECNNELSSSTWERMKALKIDSLFKKKNNNNI